MDLNAFRYWRLWRLWVRLIASLCLIHIVDCLLSGFGIGKYFINIVESCFDYSCISLCDSVVSECPIVTLNLVWRHLTRINHTFFSLSKNAVSTSQYQACCSKWYLSICYMPLSLLRLPETSLLPGHCVQMSGVLLTSIEGQQGLVFIDNYHASNFSLFSIDTVDKIRLYAINSCKLVN